MKHLKHTIFLLIVLAFSATSLLPQGFQNRSLVFNGSSHLVSPWSDGFNPSTLTVEAWIKPTSTGVLTVAEDYYNHYYRFLTVDYIQPDGWALELVNNELKFWIASTPASGMITTYSTVSASGNFLNAWNHAAATFDGDSLRVYINGIRRGAVKKQASPHNSYVRPLCVGALPDYDYYNRYNNYFIGEMDEIRLWNVARGDSAILADYNRWLTGNETGLALYYHCDEVSGTTVTNFSIPSYDAYNLSFAGTASRSLATLPGFPVVPAITSLSRLMGTVGSQMQINGRNLLPSPSVFFNGVNATITASTASRLDVTVPAGATNGPVTVTVNGLTGYSHRPFTPGFKGLRKIDATTFEFHRTVSTSYPSKKALVSDLDGDGKLDVVVGTSNNVKVYRNISTWYDLLLASPTTLTFSGTSTGSIEIADMDGDGKPDIVVAGPQSGGGHFIFRNTSTVGSISFSAYYKINASGWAISVGVQDMDGDGKPDFGYSSSMGYLSYYRNISSVGSFRFSPGSVIDWTNLTPLQFTTGNLDTGKLDPDQKPDLLAINQYDWGVYTLHNIGTMGGIRFTSYGANQTSTTNVTSPKIADFNNDGRLDIVVLCPDIPKIKLWRNNGSVNPYNFILSEVDCPTSSVEMALSDVDGDSLIDIIVTRSSGKATAFRNMSTSSALAFSSEVELETENGQTGATLGDLNNDGRPDLIVLNTNSTISLMRNNILATPGNFSASDAGVSSIDLSWEDRTEGENGYLVYRDGSQIISLNEYSTSHTDQSTSLRQGRIYTYGVTAVNNPIRSDTALDFGRLQFKGEISGSVETPRGAGVSNAIVYLARSEPNRYKALSFDGVDDYVQVPLASVQSGPLSGSFSTITLAAWVYPTAHVSASAGPTIISTTEVNGWALRLNNGYIRADLRGVASQTFTAQQVPLNQWSHIAVTYDQSSIRAYLNGNLIGSTSAPIRTVSATPNSCLFIGGEPTGCTSQCVECLWRGMLDEVSVWNIALDSSKIQQYMEQYASGNGDEPGLMGYWRFDEGSGDKTADNGSTSNYYGLLINGPTWSDNASPTRKSSVTNNRGEYTMSKIDYGDTITTYYMSARRRDDGISPDTMSVQFTRSSFTFSEKNFTDTSMFALSGKIVIAGYSDFGLKGVHLLDENGYILDSTDAVGGFSLALTGDPHTIRPVYHGHKFSPESLRVSILNDTMGIVFEDVTLDTVRGVVAAGLCKYPLGRATVRLIDTLSAKLDTTFQTSTGGFFSWKLPALPYFIFVDDLESGDADALKYFKTRKQTISLVEQDSAALADTVAYPPGVDRKYVELIYRTKPILSIQGIPRAGDCQKIVIPQGRRIPIRIKVSEKYGNRPPCRTDSGEVLISDDVGDRQNLIRSPIENGLATYIIVAGEPNILDGGNHPFQKLFEVRSTQPGGEAVEQFWMLVTGTRTAGKTFTTTTPQLPWLILRDPPGDGSFSYFKKDSTYCVDMSLSTQYEAGVELWANVRLGMKFPDLVAFLDIGNAGFYVDIEAGLGTGFDIDSGRTLTSCFRASEMLSTSDDEFFSGQKGDLYATASHILTFGISDVVSFDPGTCQAKKTKQLSFEKMEHQAGIFYTDFHIRNVEIPQLRQIISYFEQRGNLDSVEIFRSTLTMWENILKKGDEIKAQATRLTFAGQDTIGFSGGVRLARDWESTSSSTNYLEFNTYIDARFAAEAGIVAELDFAHIRGGYKTNFRWALNTRREATQTTSKAYGYELYDNDQSDRFLVGLRQAPDGGPPVFDLVSGESQCLWEPGTIKKENVSLSINNPVIKGPPGSDTVLLFVQCGNLSKERKTYLLTYPQAGRTGYPDLLVGNTAFTPTTGLDVTLDGDSSIEYRIVVRRYPEEYIYEDVTLVLRSVCDTSINDKASFSAYFHNDQNAPPKILSNAASARRNDTTVIQLKAIDPEGEPLAYTIIEEPRYGRFIDDSPPTLTYLPNPEFIGTDKFQFNVSDGVNVTIQRFAIKVENIAPVASIARIDTSLNQGTTLVLQFAADDPDGDVLRDTLIYAPKHGKLSGTSSNLTYQPDSTFAGTDDFTYGFDDGKDIARVRVNLQVNEVYYAPIVYDDTAAISGMEPSVTVNVLNDAISSQGRPLEIIDTVITSEGGYAVNNGDGTLTYYDSAATSPLWTSSNRAMLALAAPVMRQIAYHVTDGIDTTEALLIIEVDRANTRPVAGFGTALTFDGVNDGVTTNQYALPTDEITIEYWFKGDTAQSIVRHQWDEAYIVSGWYGLHILSNDGGTSGGISTGDITDGNWHHVAMTWKRNTTDGFRSYRDGQLVASRTSSDLPIPSPLINPMTFGYSFEGHLEFTKGSLDEVRIWNIALPDSEIQKYMSLPRMGTEPGLVGYWRFDEQIGDSTRDATSTGASAFLKNMTNQWTANDVLLKTTIIEEDTSSLSLPAYDIDGDPLTYTIIGQPLHGKLLTVGATSTYVPDKDFTGYDYITYTVSDGKTGSLNPATLSIYVQNTQDPPVAKSFAYEIRKNKNVFIRLIANDPDPLDTLLQYLVNQPLHGALVEADTTYSNEFYYQPAQGYTGADSFAYRVTDGTDTSTAVISILITNTHPVAGDTLLAQAVGTTFTFTLPGTDADGDTLLFSILIGVEHGTLDIDSLPIIVYAPTPGYHGPDSMVYIVTDGTEADTGVVNFRILLPTAVVEQKPPLPTVYELYQNYPNPFNPITNIEYDLPQISRVTLKIYNVLGQVVVTLVDDIVQPGKRVVSFNANRYASGVYFYRLVAEPLHGKGDGMTRSFMKVQKMLLLK